MPRFVDTVRSSRPYTMYLLDLTRADLDTGVVAAEGTNPINAAIVENVTKVLVKPPLIPGVTSALHPQVQHERQANLAAQNYSAITVAGLAATLWDDWTDWSVEVVFALSEYQRARNAATGGVITIDATERQAVMFQRLLDADFNVYYEYAITVRNGFDSTDKVIASTSGIKLYPGTTYHMVWQRIDTYNVALFINGVLAENFSLTDLYGETFTYATTTSSTLVVGGYNSADHADATVALVAVYDKVLSSTEIQAHYDALLYRTGSYESISQLAPDFSIRPSSSTVGKLEPHVDAIANYIDDTTLYSHPSGYVTIQLTQLGSGAYSTSEKKLRIDLTQFDTIARTYFDMTTTTDANSSVVAQYSIDGGAFVTLAEGTDTIPELLVADAGGAV